MGSDWGDTEIEFGHVVSRLETLEVPKESLA